VAPYDGAGQQLKGHFRGDHPHPCKHPTGPCRLVHRRTCRTRDQAREEIFRWIEGWYNTRRRHSSLDYQSPADYEELYEQRRGPFGPVDPDQPAFTGALAGVEPLTASNRKLSTEPR
jgi:hypothetical protein